MEDNRLTYPVVVVSAISSILLKVGRSSLPVDRISPNGINWSLSPPQSCLMERSQNLLPECQGTNNTTIPILQIALDESLACRGVYTA